MYSFTLVKWHNRILCLIFFLYQNYRIKTCFVNKLPAWKTRIIQRVGCWLEVVRQDWQNETKRYVNTNVCVTFRRLQTFNYFMNCLRFSASTFQALNIILVFISSSTVKDFLPDGLQWYTWAVTMIGSFSSRVVSIFFFAFSVYLAENGRDGPRRVATMFRRQRFHTRN